MKRLLILTVAFLTISISVLAQVTTSGITGAVMAGGEEAIGATVTAKHVPSGSVYRAVTNIDGHYSIMDIKYLVRMVEFSSQMINIRAI